MIADMKKVDVSKLWGPAWASDRYRLSLSQSQSALLNETVIRTSRIEAVIQSNIIDR